MLARFANILSWLVSTFAPSQLTRLLPKCGQEDLFSQPSSNATRCISIGRPGGLEWLRIITLRPVVATLGYNLRDHTPFSNQITNTIPTGGVVLNNKAFSVNYADCCIRWGLYESAKRFVERRPIVPGFDVAGTIERVGSSSSTSSFQVGAKVFGVTLFGVYSSRVLVPAIQLSKILESMSMEQAASLPTVALTAL
jgi:hypothetical protein